mmetsp:Transcript_151875/g.485436  ORF Transcript_151875/g.485436 Transcript_151875/m.485436 type:complete len:239 (-) Transcript_151875:532-1248(-)
MRARTCEIWWKPWCKLLTLSARMLVLERPRLRLRLPRQCHHTPTPFSCRTLGHPHRPARPRALRNCLRAERSPALSVRRLRIRGRSGPQHACHCPLRSCSWVCVGMSPLRLVKLWHRHVRRRPLAPRRFLLLLAVSQTSSPSLVHPASDTAFRPHSTAHLLVVLRMQSTSREDWIVNPWMAVLRLRLRHPGVLLCARRRRPRMTLKMRFLMLPSVQVCPAVKRYVVKASPRKPRDCRR